MAKMMGQARQITFSTLIRAHADANAARAALIEGDRCLTWAELERRTNGLARVLLTQGVRKGDRIALLLNDGAQFIEMMLAAGKIGAISMLLNWRLAPAELSWIIRDGAPRVIFRAGRFDGLADNADSIVDHVIADEAGGVDRYERWAGEGDAAVLNTGVSGHDPLFMMFTSGTTGRPKGCLHSHAGAFLSALSFASRRGFVREDVNLSTNPLFHVAGLQHVFAAMAVGAANVFVPRDAAVTAPVELALRHRCTLATLGVPLMSALKASDEQSIAGLEFRSITGGAGMTDPQRFAFVREQLGASLVGGWGQTEACGFGTQIDWPDMVEHPTAIGWPIPHAEMCILDNEGNPAADQSVEGEIGFRGPTVMLGYWNNLEATEAALGTGWLRTGDIAFRDCRGLFHIKGRLKELIKTGGENVYPAEVEEVIKTLPAVADAAVAGVKDRRWGEAVKAFVVLKHGASLTAEDLTAACRARIAGYKRPRYLEFLEVIPRDHLGKIQRVQLAARGATPGQAIP